MSGFGQEPDQQPPDKKPEIPSDVYVNDSFEASDSLVKARALWEQQRWREAAELLQSVADSLGDRVIRTERGFSSFRDHVNAILCGWPGDGLRAYQSLYDPKLQKELGELDAASQLEAATRLFDQYFCTSGAAAMAEQIAQVAIEAGDFYLARWALSRVLESHPASRNFAIRYQSLLGLVMAMQGELPDDQAHKLGGTRMRWKGRDASLSEALSEIAAEFDTSSSASPDDWPVLGGNRERSRTTTTNVTEPGLLWRYAHRPVPKEKSSDGIMEELVRGSSGGGLTVLPVASGELVYVQSYRDVVALRRNSGAVAWAVRSEESDTDSTYGEERVGFDTPAVEGGRLFAALPTRDATFYDYETARTVHELVALDAQTGAELWRVAQKRAEAQGTALAFDSAPIARSGRVYIVSRRKRSFGFEDCYLDCYRASDGERLFRTHLASASTSALGVRGATQSVVSLHGDRVYVCTNVGAVAAVSAYTGAIQWLHLYDRIRPDSATGWPTREAIQSGPNAALWSDGRIFALPADAPLLLVFSANDGRVIHSVAARKLADMYALYGVRGDVVCGVGDRVLCHDLAADNTLWSATVGDDDKPVGRGAWAGEALLVPLHNRLLRVQAADGASAGLPMGPHYQGGNVLALPEQILVAGRDEVVCYVRKAEIWRNIEQRMADAPEDPLPALEFTEVALGAGETEDAIKALREAVRRAGPVLSAAAPPIRSRIFTNTLKVLDALNAPPEDIVEVLFRYAAESATEPQAQIDYRMQFARHFERSGAPARAIRLYQQILRDRTLREWPTARPDASVPRAHVRASQAIDALIRQHGREAYSEIEAEAGQWLDEAKAAEDETRLQRLVETYPNSQAAWEAMVYHAGLLARRGQHGASAKLWERAYHRQLDTPRKIQILAQIAQSYERAGKPEIAFLWMSKAAREFPTASIEMGGRTTTFAAQRERLEVFRSLVEPVGPHVQLPLKAGIERDLVGPVRLLSPYFAQIPGTSWSNVYVQNPDGIRGYEAAGGEDLWTQPAPVRMNADLLTSWPGLAMFATPFEIFAIDIATGSRLYSHGEYPARLGDPGADWEDGSNFRVHALHGDRLVSVREDGHATCLNIVTGDILWSVTRRPAPAGPMVLTDSVLAYHVSREGRALLQVVSADTGELLESVLTDEHRPVMGLHATLDGFLVLVTSKTISSYDAARQERLWHVALNWPIREATLQFDLDGLYFIDEAGSLKKFSLGDGRMEWESERVLGRGDDHESLMRQGEYLLVSGNESVSGLDVANGLLLWEGTVPEDVRFVQRVLTRWYFAALHKPRGSGKESQIYFYDHRHGSGVIPRVGGVLDLGSEHEVHEFLAADGAVVVRSGTRIRGFISADRAPGPP